MAQSNKPTRRKRPSRKETKAAAEHAGAERNGGTAQHSSQPRPSVNDSRHGLRRRRKKETAKQEASRKGRAAAQRSKAVATTRSTSDKVKTETPAEETGKAAPAIDPGRGSQRVSEPVQATPPAIETQIPSIASDFASVLTPQPSAEAASSPAEPDQTRAAQEDARPAEASVERAGTDADPSVSSAKGAADASQVLQQGADESRRGDADATVSDAAREAEEGGTASAAFSTDASAAKQRPSFSGKRATGPDIIDHVKERARRKRHRRKALIIILIIVAVVAVVGGLFAWQRWFRYDDAADIQGTWQLNANKKQAVVIDDTHIDLIKGLAYTYTLNTTDKTISFTFNGETGTGSYHFNDDRTVLVINESGETPNMLVQLGLQEDPAIQDDTMKDDVTVLTKTSDDTTAHYKGKKIRSTSSSKKSSSSSSSDTSSDSSSSETGDTSSTTATSDDSQSSSNG